MGGRGADRRARASSSGIAPARTLVRLKVGVRDTAVLALSLPPPKQNKTKHTHHTWVAGLDVVALVADADDGGHVAHFDVAVGRGHGQHHGVARKLQASHRACGRCCRRSTPNSQDALENSSCFAHQPALRLHRCFRCFAAPCAASTSSNTHTHHTILTHPPHPTPPSPPPASLALTVHLMHPGRLGLAHVCVERVGHVGPLKVLLARGVLQADTLQARGSCARACACIWQPWPSWGWWWQHNLQQLLPARHWWWWWLHTLGGESSGAGQARPEYSTTPCVTLLHATLAGGGGGGGWGCLLCRPLPSLLMSPCSPARAAS